MSDRSPNQAAHSEPAMTVGRVILWWELRRILFNAILLVIGLAAVIGGLSLIDLAYPDRDVGSPILGIILFGFVANLCYTLGWIVEIKGRQTDPASARSRGTRMFRWGMFSSSLLATFPLWVGLGFWIVNRVHHH
jgi:hypothetical protein